MSCADILKVETLDDKELRKSVENSDVSIDEVPKVDEVGGSDADVVCCIDTPDI